MACAGVCQKAEGAEKSPKCAEGGDERQPSLEYQFATTTTLHGMARVAESSGIRAKTPWVLALLIAGGVYVHVTVDRFQAYLSYDANTNVIVDFNSTLAFPAVTVCNYNRFMNYRIAEEDKKYVSTLLQVEEYFDFWDAEPDFNLTAVDDGFNYTLFALSTGFLLDDSLRLCSWKGGDCDASNFSIFYSPTYGQCYTFNGDSRGRPNPYEQSRQGIGNGLRLIIDIKQPDYTETYESGHLEAGLKFAVHSPDEVPLMDTVALSATPGLHTFASMRLVRHINLPKPWGVCGRETEDRYSRNNCLRNCRRDAIIDRCSCRPLGYDAAHRLSDGPVRHCDIDDFRCVRDALRLHRGSSPESDCVCPVACDYATYDTTLSTATYPSRSVLRAALSDLGDASGLYDSDYVRENLVYLDVYYGELSTITYEQVEALPFTALLGDLGGQLGLFLGASVLTGMELLEYVTRRLKLLVVRVKSKNEVQPWSNRGSDAL